MVPSPWSWTLITGSPIKVLKSHLVLGPHPFMSPRLHTFIPTWTKYPKPQWHYFSSSDPEQLPWFLHMTTPHASLDYPAILRKCLHYVSVRVQDVNHLPRVCLPWVFYHSWLCYEGRTSHNLDHSLSFCLSDCLLWRRQTESSPF